MCALPLSHLLDFRRRRQSKEYEHGLIEAQDILVIEAPDVGAELGFWHRGHLVHHEPAGDAQSIALVRFDGKPEQWSFRVVRRERADRDGFCAVKTVILEDNDWPRFARIVLSPRNGPDVAASHSCSSSEVDTASMNA